MEPIGNYLYHAAQARLAADRAHTEGDRVRALEVEQAWRAMAEQAERATADGGQLPRERHGIARHILTAESGSEAIQLTTDIIARAANREA